MPPEIFSWVFIAATFLIAVTVHEYAHGVTAHYFGDDTAKRLGRLSLNPLRHIDPWWTVVLPLLLVRLGLPAIGMAKPVPVDFSRLNHPKRDMIWVALAGPASNLVLAVLFASLYRLSASVLFLLPVYVNLGLALFNLIPVPPLDGSRVLTGLLPLRWAVEYVKMERFGFLLVLVLVWLGVFKQVILPALNACAALLGVPVLG